MYSFLTGPMLWLATLVFVLGLGWRAVHYVKGLDWRLERVAYGPGRKIGLKGAVTSVLQWLVPFGTHSWRKQPYFTIAFFLFHIGLVLVPLFLAGHMVIMQERFGFSLPTLPMGVSDTLTVLAIIGGIMMVLRRIALPEVRFITDKADWFVLCLTLFVLVAGFLARMQAFGYEDWLLWHIFAAELVLVLAPFTKLSHIVLYFLSRGQLGMDFAIKRGGASRGPAYPW
ncbi:MAG: respiratory nitrate reductase subunit gamma [Bilophila sp.]